MFTAASTTFLVYLIVLLWIGFYFYRRSRNIEDYLLGGRGMGAWVTALSAQASDMSGWLLMGLPAAIYLHGIGQTWIAVGLFIGTVLNWLLVAKRLRIYTEKTNAITLPSFFEERFKDPTGLLRIVSAIIILFFFTIYASSGLVAAGRLFESIFEFKYHYAVLIGGVIIVGYTFMGGFLAVCWTDLFQGILMLLALIIVPIIAAVNLPGAEAAGAEVVPEIPVPESNGLSILSIISLSAWGLGYFGQPHILARFMSAKSLTKIRQSMAIAFVWVFLSLAGAVVVGLVSIDMFDNLTKAEADKVFIKMIQDLFNPWVGGVLLAAILSAIMSTIDSQLLVSSSALTEDFYKKIIKKDASEKEIILVGRICVIIISLIALVLAMDPENSIMEIVSYSWGGFGAAFGPVVLFALFSKKTTWQAALAGMITGALVLVLWKHTPLADKMYELVPGFIANCLTMVTVNCFVAHKNPDIIAEYEQVENIVRGNL